MNKLSRMAIVIALVAPTAAFAADMASPVYRKAPAAVAPVYDWSGFYIGGFGGGGYGNHDLNNALGPSSPSANATANYSSSGAIGGIDGGYNWSIGHYVLGLEGDFAWSGIKGNDRFFLGSNDETDLRWAGTVRGRLGFAVDRLMVFSTAGWAYGNQRHTNIDLVNGVDQFSSSKDGWTAGGGIEGALSQNWIAKVEYRYYDFGDYSRAGAPFTPNGQLPYSVHSTYSTVTLGLNYKFSPLVVRY